MEIKIVIDEQRLMSRLGRMLRSRSFRVALVIACMLAPVAGYALTKAYTFKDGDLISASQVNTNFDDIIKAINALPQSKTKFPDSKIISDADGEMINAWVGSINRVWTLCYRRSTDGASSSTFHSKCNNKGDTVTVVKATNGKVFGGYAGCSWTSVGNYQYQCGGSFVFSLTSLHKYNKHFYHNTYSGNSFSYLYWIYDHSSYGPTFGGGHDLYMDSNLNGNCNLGHDYTCRYSDTSNGGYSTSTCNNDFCGGTSWSASEVEVWYYNG